MTGHFADSRWNNPCGPVFKTTVTGFGPTANGLGNFQYITGASYIAPRDGIYKATAMAYATANGTEGATFTMGVTFTDDIGATNKSISRTSEFSVGLCPTDLPVVFEAKKGTEIKFYYNYTGNTGSNQTLAADFLIRAL